MFKVRVKDSHVDLGSIYKLEQTSKQFSITNLEANENTGNFMTISSENAQKVKLNRVIMVKNSGKEALLYVSRGIDLEIQNSIFTENHSLARGSIILAETNTAVVHVYNTTFSSNYAIQGGVFFVQIYALINISDCTFERNFALLGGVLYQQSEGYAKFLNSTFRENLAIHASIIYSINSQSSIEISGGQIARNGFSYKTIEQVDSVFGLKGGSSNYSQNYIAALEVQLQQAISLIAVMLKDESYEDFQIQVVKALITIKDGVKVTQQVFLLHQTSASIAEIDGLEYSDTFSMKPLIMTESSIISFNNISFTRIISNTHVIRCLSDSLGHIINLQATNSTFALLYIISSNFIGFIE
ncbi:hypothetical protein FGO68_gene8181 [Halteria grandinella]|uniref:Uncharacterized protein n=1 Tax=Halteria grandinella TaxID=5974 RepID=A0A8J8SYF6_HALGN|nr:hypothetical protein FGO68_gene8181 [Halteria grandinella]